MPVKQPTAVEIADRIAEHLQRFESDKALRKMLKLRWPVACQGLAGKYVGIAYKVGQCVTFLKVDRALAYLAWLDAGNIGTHMDYERSGK